MSEILHNIDTFLKQVAQQGEKIYLKPGETPPKDVQVMQGKRGGRFYISSVPNKAKISPKSLLMKDSLVNPIRRLLDRKDKITVDDYTRVTESLARENESFWGSLKDSDIAEDSDQDIKSATMDDDQAVPFFIFAQVLLGKEHNFYDAIEHWKKHLGREMKSKELQKTFDRSGHIWQKNYEFIQEILQNRTVTLYRGCNGKSIRGRHKKGEKVTIKDKIGISRFSLSKEVAEGFLDDREKGFVIKIQIPAKNIFYMENLMGDSSGYSEAEFIAFCDDLEAEIIEAK